MSAGAPFSIPAAVSALPPSQRVSLEQAGGFNTSLNAIERAGGPEKLESALKRLNNGQPISKTELEVIQQIGGQIHANNVIDAVKAVKKKRRKPLGRKPVGRKPVGRKPVGRKPVGRKPVGRKPVGRKPVGRKPVGRKPVDRKPVGRKPVDRKPVGRKPVGRKPVPVAKKRVIKTAKSCPICPMVRAQTLINRLSKDNIKNILVKVLKSRR